MQMQSIQRLAASAGLLRLQAAAVVALTMLAGCAGVPATGPGKLGEPARSAGDCLVFLEELDRVVHVAGTGDGGEHRVAGFPYLRVDRFTASLRPEAAAADVRYRPWVERMRALDTQARGYETANLPDEAFPVLGMLDRGQVAAQVQSCGSLLVSDHAMAAPQRRRLRAAVVVPDDYSMVKRALGLYSLTGMPFAAGERAWQRHTRRTFAAQRKAPPPDSVAYQEYLPREKPLSAEEALADARAAMAASPLDVLGIPQISEASRERLLDAYAPSFEIATRAEYDRFGPLQWIDLEGLVAPNAQRYWLDVDPSQPVVYRRLAFTRYGTAVLPQLVYTIWFSERPMQEAGDFLGGRLDGLVWRVTLDEQGAPLLYDTIQPSGRFAMFFPTSRLRAKPPPESEPLIEWAFSPIDEPIGQWVGAEKGLAGVSLRIESQTHQLVGLGLPGARWGEPVGRNAPYRLVDANRLRMLPLPGRGSRSIFDAKGVVPNTERLARYFFWPMGIARPGSMRQWGRQPTAFIGRRHFDDADLLEKRFERLKQAPPGQR
ncbi:MAG: hypothetical protein H0T52_09880 [Lautropia sp.]|nr:hypothetical protein [Lautropia sp.]